MNGRFKAPVDRQALYQLWLKTQSEPREALSALCAQCRDKKAAEYINSLMDRPRLRALLTHEDAKTRKNAARLCGTLGDIKDLPALENALENERTWFVAPSVILAIGSLGSEKQLALLEGYVKTLPEMDEKQLADIKDALQTAVAKLKPHTRAEFAWKAISREILLTATRGTLEALEAEVKAAGIAYEKNPIGLTAIRCDYNRLFELRCFEEALIPLAPYKTGGTVRESDITEAVKRSGFEKLALSMYKTPPAYRIELRIPGIDRSAAASAVKKLIALENSTSNYDAELRILHTGDMLRLYAKPCGLDARFVYRKQTLSASIDPVTAAAIARLCMKYIKSGARVIDPCCGTGTLLAERSLCSGGIKELVGVDIDTLAAASARENMKAAGVKSSIICGDMAKFSPKAPFDELYANLPFGTRVGVKESNDRLYHTLINRLDEYVAPDGFAALYTTQGEALTRMLMVSPWQPVERFAFDAGGLMPRLFILKRKR